MSNFWDSSVWGSLNLVTVLLLSLLAASLLKKSVKVLQDSLIPTSVVGGAILLCIAAIYKFITKEVMFDTAFFGGRWHLDLLHLHLPVPAKSLVNKEILKYLTPV